MSKKTARVNGYWRDRMGFSRTGVSLMMASGSDFTVAKAFMTAMQAYSNLALKRITHTIQEIEQVTGTTAGTGHFDLANYVARMSFYNYAAEDAGDSPNTTLAILAPKDDLIVESKDGIWLVDDAKGQEIAGHIATGLGLSADQIEFIRGEVPEN